MKKTWKVWRRKSGEGEKGNSSGKEWKNRIFCANRNLANITVGGIVFSTKLNSAKH